MTRAQHKFVSYLVAIGSIALAVVVRMLLDPILDREHPHFTFMFAVIVTAWYGELGPSILAVILGFLAVAYFFAYPRGSFAVSGIDAQLGMVLYVVVSLSIVLFSQLMHSANQRANAYASELLKKQADLELQVVKRRQAQDAQLSLLRRMVDVQEEERRRISRELHDQCGQDVTALRLGLKRMESTVAEDPDANKQYKNLHQLLDQISMEMHHLAQELRPPALDELGLLSAVEGYLKTWSSRTGVSVEFEHHGMAGKRISPHIETALYRILQEALTNVAKHASATRVSVIMKQDERGVQMIVEDEGAGFDIESHSLDADARQHLGLLGMRERIEAVGGALDIESTQGTGTTVFAKVPLT